MATSRKRTSTTTSTLSKSMKQSGSKRASITVFPNDAPILDAETGQFVGKDVKSLKVHSEGLMETSKGERKLYEGGSISNLKGVVPSKSSHSFQKLFIRFIPQCAPLGNTKRYSDVMYHPFPDDERKIEADNFRFGHVLALFASKAETNLYSSILALIPLDNISVHSGEGFQFLISQKDDIKKKDVFRFQTSSLKAVGEWISMIGQISSFTPALATYSLVKGMSSSVIQKIESSLSSYAKFQRQEVTEEAEPSDSEPSLQMIAGTLEDFIECAFLQCHTDENESEILYAFLMYRKIQEMPMEQFLSLLTCLWKKMAILAPVAGFNALENIRIFGEQISRSYTLLTSEERKEIVDFCKWKLKRRYTQCMKGNLKIYLFESKISSLQTKTITPDKILHATWVPTPHIESIKKITGIALAEQITLLEAAHYREIKPMELLNKTPDGCGLKLATDWWNTVSCWVAGEILKESTAKGQLKLVKKFTIVAQKLFKMNNFSSCAQVLFGVTHQAIQRLKGLQEIIPVKYLDRISDLKEKFSHSENYKAYRTMQHSSPFLSFLAIYQRDLLHIMDGNVTFFGNDLALNVEKFLMITEVIRKSGMLNPQYHCHYTFQSDPEVQQYIIHHATYTEEELYRLSEKIAPRNAEKTFNPLFGNQTLINKQTPK